MDDDPFDIETLRNNERKIFYIRTISLTTLCIFLAAVQWSILILSRLIEPDMTKYWYLCLIPLVAAFVGITVIIFFPDILNLVPCNWFLVIAIVECFTWGLSSGIIMVEFNQFGFTFLIVLTIFVMLLVMGAILPRQVSLDLAVSLVTLIFAVSLATFAVLQVVSVVVVSPIAFAVIAFISFGLIVVQHAQYIYDGRDNFLRTPSYLLSSLKLFLDFSLLLLLLCTVIPRFPPLERNK